ncbi:MAG: glycerol kinase, partial [Acetobacteraceae bacterium]
AEATALGAAGAAGLAVGLWPDPAALRGLAKVTRHWEPSMPAGRRDALAASWHKAVTRALDWEV